MILELFLWQVTKLVTHWRTQGPITIVSRNNTREPMKGQNHISCIGQSNLFEILSNSLHRLSVWLSIVWQKSELLKQLIPVYCWQPISCYSNRKSRAVLFWRPVVLSSPISWLISTKFFAVRFVALEIRQALRDLSLWSSESKWRV